jgi:transcription-repair coupling factor (superfamily II helicase)
MKKSGTIPDLTAFPIDWFNRGFLPPLRNALDGGQPINLSMIPAAAQAFVVAGLSRGLDRPCLVTVKNVKTQEELANDLEVWGIPCLFFPQTEPLVAGALPDQEMAAERLAALDQMVPEFKGLVLATSLGLGQNLPAPGELISARLVLQPGREMDRDAWLAQLAEAGYQREAQVEERGTFSVHGAVIDVFSRHAQRPVRTEWEANHLVSLREFDSAAQRSVRPLPEAVIFLAAPDFSGAQSASTLRDYLPAGTLHINFDDTEDDLDAKPGPDGIEFFTHDFLHAPRGDFILQEKRRDLFLDHLAGWMEENWEIAVFCNNDGEQRRLIEIVRESGLDSERLKFWQRPLLRGFVWPQGKLVALSDAEIFGRYQTLRSLRKQEKLASLRAQQTALDFSEIAEGDYVVHLNHGFALYGGLQTLPDENGRDSEVLVLEFADQARLFVPVEQAFLVSKYVGVGKKTPALDTLGGARWERAKVSTRKAVMDYAAELLKVQAERDSLPGHAFSPDTPWQAEFEEAFIYDETVDQVKAIDDTKRDMESTRPMDRLICGDVGFGKTEIAIRAAFKAVLDGRQVAFLVPTTVLAQQHFQTLRERFADYPIKVEVLSRFRTVTEQRKVVQDARDGSVDIIVGTHRLISKDVVFKDLGLVIVDEEQRFGVEQKEKFKQRFRLVDVLTLSATPIPRTLYLSLTGARDMSLVETAPPNRFPVETIVAPYDERIIREAIEREMARNGQVYFLHNRIGTIHNVADKLKMLVPCARIDIGHGQMDADDLEEVMARFVAGETDVLLSTTIIESGLDIPNANTILIDRADRFGLADLYQLRGRVGRAHHKAYAYLFLPRHLMTVADARTRVNAIRQYSQLGAGFKIAMRDLEIRGAGSILGTAQSGHITAVGFELYCQLLKQAVAQTKGDTGRISRLPECRLQIDFLAWREYGTGVDQAGAYIPRNYMPESRWRIEAYRRLAELRSLEEIEALRQEWRDRYGPFPDAVSLLWLATEIRLRAAMQNITIVETQDEKLILKQGSHGDDFVMVGGKFPRLTGRDPFSKLAEINRWITSLAKADSNPA